MKTSLIGCGITTIKERGHSPLNSTQIGCLIKMPYFIVYHHKIWLNPAFYLIKSKIKARDDEHLAEILEANYGMVGLDYFVTFCCQLASDYDGADLLL